MLPQTGSKHKNSTAAKSTVIKDEKRWPALFYLTDLELL
jgi:hypothetical protein